MVRPALDPETKLLACAGDRILVCTGTPANGSAEVRKILFAGSPVDADREVAWGRRLAHLDVVRYLGAEQDQTTGRPCVRMAFHDGEDLASMVAARGALPAAVAVAALAPAARTLAAMHALRSPEMPRGACHGDVKPANLLRTATTTLLLDFEHARACGAVAEASFTGGTPGFAPPEAERGAPPEAAFDVYGLGATLHWLCTGGAAERPARLGLHPDLCHLIAACTAAVPAARPDMATVADALADLATLLADDPAERVQHSILRGDLEAAEAQLQQVEPARGERLRQLIRRRRGLLRRRPNLLELPAAAPTDPEPLRRELLAVRAILRRFPANATALRRHAALRDTIGSVLAETLPRIHELRREESFAAGIEWLRAAIELVRTAAALPGGLRIPGEQNPFLPGPLQRQPVAFLERNLREFTAAADENAHLDAQIAAAEANLDLPAAEAAIDCIAGAYGGTSAAVARRRDRHLRLAFYLERIGRCAANVERLQALQPESQLAGLRQFVSDCAAAGANPGARGDRGALGLRSLQLTISNLVEEYDALHDRGEPCLRALGAALELASDRAADLIADAAQKLRAVPVPVRPLQAILGRLDSFRVLEAFVDRPHRPRSQLLDRIETLRLELEQARATRDRLASGAERSLQRGHYTTGLFDMERAVESLAGDDEVGTEASESRRLRERLREARQKKQEIEAAIRRNMELASLYARQQDAIGVGFAERVQMLRERRECLHFLAMHVAADRGRLYARDLREVETLLAQEQAAQAQADYDRAASTTGRQRILQSTIELLDASLRASSADGGEPPGRLVRLLEHWHELRAATQRELAAAAQGRVLAARRRTRRIALAAASAAATVLAAFLLPRLFGDAEALAAARAATLLEPRRAAAAIVADRPGAFHDLARCAEELPQGCRAQAVEVVAIAQRAVDLRSEAVAAWHAELMVGIHALAAILPESEAAPCRSVACRFATECWRRALLVAGAGLPDATDRLFAAAQAAAERTAANGIPLPPGLEIELAALRR
jgi:hypothetical protein